MRGPTRLANSRADLTAIGHGCASDARIATGRSLDEPIGPRPPVPRLDSPLLVPFEAVEVTTGSSDEPILTPVPASHRPHVASVHWMNMPPIAALHPARMLRPMSGIGSRA